MHRAGEKPGQQHDRERSEADHVDLLEEVAGVERPAERRAENGETQAEVLLHFEQAPS